MAAILRATPLPRTFPAGQAHVRSARRPWRGPISPVCPKCMTRRQKPRFSPTCSAARPTQPQRWQSAAAVTAALAGRQRPSPNSPHGWCWSRLGLARRRAYAKAIRAPFELATLQGFARDLSATLVYAGFAFGAGAILVLPANVGPARPFWPSAPAHRRWSARSCVRDMTLCFLIPAVTLSAFAAVLRPFQGGMTDMAAMLVAGARRRGRRPACRTADRPADRAGSGRAPAGLSPPHFRLPVEWRSGSVPRR